MLRRCAAVVGIIGLALGGAGGCTPSGDTLGRDTVTVTAPPRALLAAPLAPLPAPIVSMSTLTLRTPDSVGIVIAWTKRCTGGTCPSAWAVAASVNGQVERSGTLDRLRDTLRLEKAECPETLTVKAAVIAQAAGQMSIPGGSLLRVRCYIQPPSNRTSVAAAAFADSFPTIVTRSGLPVGRNVRIGETAQAFCRLARNRYTQDVIIIAHASWSQAMQETYFARCEGARLAYEAERSG